MATALAPASRDTIARHVVTEVPVARETATVASAIAALRARRAELGDAVYIVDTRDHLAGVVPVDALLRADDAVVLRDLMVRDAPRVRSRDDQEHVADAAIRGRATAVAVVDREGRLLGAVPARALLAILREEHVEDLHRLAGIQREVARDRDALEGHPMRRARHRLPWLVLGLAGSMLAALLVAGFEDVIARDLTVAFFVPAIVYIADAIGTQTEAIVIRGLSISRVPLGTLITDELRTGFLIGVVLAVLAFPLVWLAFGDARLAAVVAGSIVAAGTVATTIGLVLPALLQRAGRDPAYGSGPLATIVQDVTSLVIYLGLARLVLA